MPKETPLNSKRSEDSVEEVLARIAETRLLSDKIRKEAGYSKKTLKESPNDIYFYELTLEDCKSSFRLGFHGKCSKAGLKPYIKSNHIIVQTGHASFQDKTLSRTGCVLCGQLLDPEEAEKMIATQKIKIAKTIENWEKKKQRQLERDKELAILGGI